MSIVDLSMNERAKVGETISFLLDQTVRQSKLFTQRQMDQLGLNITVEQWTLLKVVAENGRISQVDLSLKAQKDTASITRMLDLLQKKDMVRRTADDMDRRKFLISLTESGQIFFNRHTAQMDALRSKIVEGLSDQELADLERILERFRQNIV